MASPTRKLALIKNQDRYVFCFDEAGVEEMLATLNRFAQDESLDFDAFDAAVLGEQVRNGWRRPAWPRV